MTRTDFATDPAVRRHPGNPVLTADDVPYPSDLVLNPGVACYQGRYVMIFRNDYGWEEDTGRFTGTNLGLAFSDDGLSWQVRPRPCFSLQDEDIRRVYDPRLTVIDGRCYMCFAVDSRHGVRAGIAVTDDFERFEVRTLTLPENRNMVLFPERVGGLYVRLDRTFPLYLRQGNDRFDIWLSDSPDLRYWGDHQLVLGAANVRFANDKIGPGTPPIRTDKGWLTLFHAVWRDRSRGGNGWEHQPWQKVYTAGVMLLDLGDPSRIVGRCPRPILAPEAPYETAGGFRNEVIFPTGLIREGDAVRIYYGAADTTVCVAEADLDDLIRLALEAT